MGPVVGLYVYGEKFRRRREEKLLRVLCGSGEVYGDCGLPEETLGKPRDIQRRGMGTHQPKNSNESQSLSLKIR